MRLTYHPGPLDHFFNFRLSERQLLGDLSPEAVKAFEIAKVAASYQKGSIIFAEGQPLQGVYFLGHGRAKLSLELDREGERIIRVAGPGEVLGLIETIANKPYEVSVETITDCRVGYIRRRSFLRLLREQPEICFRVVELLGRNLHISYEQLRRLEKAPSVVARLAHLLLD